MVKRGLLFTILVGLLPVAAFASNSGITYQGRILKPDGSPLTGAAVQFKLQIRTPDSNNCLMYEELQTLDLRNTGGQFSLTINDGSGARMDSSGFGLDRIFANRGSFTFNPATCSSGSTYAPNEGDGRNLVVLFKDETMVTWEPVPAQKINFVPFAFESKQLQGFGADSLLRVVSASGDPLTGVSPLSNTQYNELLALSNGTSTQFTKSGQLNGVALPVMNSGEVLGWNGSAWVSQVASGGPNSVTTAMIQNAAVDSSKIAGNVSINTTGTLGSAITTTRDLKIYAASPSTFYVGMLADPALAGSYALTWPLTAGSANQVLTTDGSGKLTWTSPSSAGITDLTGDVTATGPGSAAATVTSVGGSAAADIHTAELAANAATSVNTPNTIVKRDGSGGFTAGALTAATVKADTLQLDNSGSVVSIANPTGAVYTLTLPTGTGSSGQVLTTNGSGVTSWVTPLSSSTAFVQDGNVFGAHANLGTNDGFDLKIRTNGTTRMTFTSGGNVGIGTTSPGEKFDVANRMRLSSEYTWPVFTLQGTDTSYPPSIVFKHGGGTLAAPTSSTAGMSMGAVRFVDPVYANGGSVVEAESTENHSAANLGSNLKFWTTPNGGNSQQIRMTITPSGNVGIGTTEPSSPLTVNGVIESTSGGIKFPDGTTQTTAASGGSSQWTTHGSNISYDGAGNVGIGTTSPTGVLDIHTSGNGSNGFVNIKNTNAGTMAAATLNMANDNGSATLKIQSTSSGNTGSPYGASLSVIDAASGGLWLSSSSTGSTSLFRVSTGGAGPAYERLRVDQNGNVGIGTTNPSEKLEVAGNVKATSFISTSDRRLKKDIAPVSGLEAILRLNGVSWRWKKTSQPDMGVIAQDVEQVFPQAVVTDMKTGFKAVKYNSLIAPLIESTKELYGLCKASDEHDRDRDRTLASLSEENKKLKSEVESLKQRLEKIETLLSRDGK